MLFCRDSSIHRSLLPFNEFFLLHFLTDWLHHSCVFMLAILHEAEGGPSFLASLATLPRTNPRHATLWKRASEIYARLSEIICTTLTLGWAAICKCAFMPLATSQTRPLINPPSPSAHNIISSPSHRHEPWLAGRTAILISLSSLLPSYARERYLIQ